ncbi:thiamine pyrophosphokinase [Pilobolus umbonatus]|nr:thiamine pyrophosphokinase [Pilobolus umbonatus]
MKHWCPSSILSRSGHGDDFCLIVLNQPITRLKLFMRLWKNASYKFVADGGANRLYDAFEHDPVLLQQGDLDSIRTEVESYYQSKGVTITRVSEQDSTDFMKCVYLLQEKEKEDKRKYDIVALPALSGRFDQTMANINLLYMMKDEIERKFSLISDENITLLLDEGEHQIHCQPELEGPTCGIMPIGSPATLTTHGLKWDMDHLRCYFGGMVSTSNAVDSDTVSIMTDAPVIWTIEIKTD